MAKWVNTVDDVDKLKELWIAVNVHSLLIYGEYVDSTFDEDKRPSSTEILDKTIKFLKDTV